MSNLSREIRQRGYYEIAVHPANFIENRIPYSELWKILQGSVVMLRGWPFPYIDQEKNAEHLEDSLRQSEDWEAHREVWRFYTSGQFIYIGAFIEDWTERQSLIGYRPKSGNPLLGCYDISSRCAEAYELAARLSNTAAGGNAMTVSISLHGIGGRQLYMEDPARALAWTNTAAIPDLTVRETVRQEDLLAQPRTLARQATQEIFLRFGFEANAAVLSALQAILQDRSTGR
jgi:hypothetical protein